MSCSHPFLLHSVLNIKLQTCGDKDTDRFLYSNHINFLLKHTTEESICTKSDSSEYRFLMVYHNQLEHSYEK